MSDPYTPPKAVIRDDSRLLRPSILGSVSWRVAAVLIILIVLPFTLRGIETMILPHTPYQLGGAIFDFGLTAAMIFLAYKAWGLGKRKPVAFQTQPMQRTDPHMNRDE